jgi:hypothetical protein
VVDSVGAKSGHERCSHLSLTDEFGEVLGTITTIESGDHGESLTSSSDIEPPENRQL